MAQFLQSYGFIIFIAVILGINFWSMRRAKKQGKSSSGMGMMGCCMGMGGMDHDEHGHSADISQLKSDNQKLQDEINKLKSGIN